MPGVVVHVELNDIDAVSVTEQITVRVSTAGGHAVVVVHGEIDLATAPALREAIAAMIRNGTRQLIMDLEGVDFLDSTALNVLVGVVRELGPGSLGVVASKSIVRRIFALSGIESVIPVFDCLDAAVEAASKAASD